MFGLQQVVVVRADFRLVRILVLGLFQPLCAVEFRGQSTEYGKNKSVGKAVLVISMTDIHSAYS